MKKAIIFLVIAALEFLMALGLLVYSLVLWNDRPPRPSYKDEILKNSYSDSAEFETDQREAMIALGQALEKDLFDGQVSREYAELWMAELEEYFDKAGKIAEKSGMTVSPVSQFVYEQYRGMIEGAKAMNSIYEPRERNEHELGFRWRNHLLHEALRSVKDRELTEEDVASGNIPDEMCRIEDHEKMLAEFETYIARTPDIETLVKKAFEDEVILQRVEHLRQEYEKEQMGDSPRVTAPQQHMVGIIEEEIYRRGATTAQEIEEIVYACIYAEYEPVDWKERYGVYEYKKYVFSFNDMGSTFGKRQNEQDFVGWADSDNHLHLINYETGERLFFRAEGREYVFDLAASNVSDCPPDGARFVPTR